MHFAFVKMDYRWKLFILFLLLQVEPSSCVEANSPLSQTDKIVVTVIVAAVGGLIIGFAACYWFRYVRNRKDHDRPLKKDHVFDRHNKKDMNRYQTNPREGYGLDDYNDRQERRGYQGGEENQWGKVLIIRKGDPKYPENSKGYSDKRSEYSERRKYYRNDDVRTNYQSDYVFGRNDRRAIEPARETSRRALPPVPEIRRDVEPYSTTIRDVGPLETYSRRAVVQQPSYVARREVITEPTVLRREVIQQPQYVARQQVVQQPAETYTTRRVVEQPAYTERRYVTTVPVQNTIAETPIAAPVQREVVYVTSEPREAVRPIGNEVVYGGRRPREFVGEDPIVPKAIVYDIPKGHNVEEFAVGRAGGGRKSFKSTRHDYVPRTDVVRTHDFSSNIPTMLRSNYKDDFF